MGGALVAKSDRLISLLTNPGWIAAAALFVLLIIRDLIRKWISQAIEIFTHVAFNRLAASALRRKARRRYASAVDKKYGRITIPFADNSTVPVDRIYVPLQAVSGNDETKARDAYASLRAATHAVVTGPPGSGKSMLLKHSLLVWALSDEGTANAFRIPVLIELHRCNGNTIQLHEHVITQLERDGLPGAKRFVQRTLEEGKLTLLLDGLDEVSTPERPRVVQMIKDFSETHSECQIVVTCRSALYEGQLQPQINATYKIAEFDEQLIRLFLRNWPNIPPDSVDQLLSALRSTPRLMQLARNPLLLTMIAYLYSDVYDGKEQMLPRSRAEFYKEVTDVLLRRLKSTINEYPAPVKKTILERLAFVGLDQPAAIADRLAIPYQRVMGEITNLLPKLTLTISDVEPLLREIVERSGLLLQIDGGERFQFAHLTLQEYLAAMYLASEPEELLARYRQDPGVWRESVKLWCGEVRRDSAVLIRPVFAEDPLLAFECLADAHDVDRMLAEEITAHFRDRLSRTRDDSSAVAAAFGVVAGDRRPHGREVFEFLTGIVQTPGDHRLPLAAEAMSATTLPEAAQQLAYAAVNAALSEQESTLVRKALVAMGEVALPPLLDQVRRGEHVSVDNVAAIGTPMAAQALCELLWSAEPTASLAAWRLAALLRNQEIEEALNRFDLPSDANDPSEAWVWYPFQTSSTSILTAVTGRIAYLIKSNSPSYTERSPDSPRADPRLTIPLCGTALAHMLSRSPSNPFVTIEQRKRIRQLPVLLRPRIFRSPPEGKMRQKEWLVALQDTACPRQDAVDHNVDLERLGTSLLEEAELSNSYFWLLSDISPAGLEALIGRLLERPSAVTRRAWQCVAGHKKPPAWERARKVVARAVVATTFVFAIYRGVVDGLRKESWFPSWLSWMIAAWILCGAMAPYFFRTRFPSGVVRSWLSGPFARIRGKLWTRWLLRLLACGSPLVLVVLFITLNSYLAWWQTTLVLIGYVALLWVSTHVKIVSANPFDELLGLETRATRARTSVIAQSETSAAPPTATLPMRSISFLSR
jgi:hypothetical protein